MKSMILEDR